MWNLRQISSVTLGLVCGVAGAGRAEILAKGGLELSGDFRARLESDWDSQRADGSERDDRTRTRVRLRLALDYAATRFLSFGVRLRSGSDFSHQSPHITVVDFDDNDTGDADFNLDRWFVEAKSDRAWAWIGRNSLPFWKQNELFWDDDVTPAGLAVGTRHDLGGGNLALNAGYFSLPVGMRELAGKLGAAQLVYSKAVGGGGVTAAAGLLSFDASSADPDAALLLSGNGRRDYTIWVGSLQGRLKAGRLPLRFGADLLHNGEGYSSTDPDPFTVAHRDQTDGLVLSARLGGLDEKGNWLAAYTYARIETFAVNASFAQDDWVRWGSATETRGSDLRGHELRFAYALAKQADLVVRLYLVEAITTDEDGNRLRVDLNYKF